MDIANERQAIRIEQDELFERRKLIAIKRGALRRRLDEIGKRLLEASTSPLGEIGGLLAEHTDARAEFEKVLHIERDLQRKIDKTFARETALDRKEMRTLRQ